METQYPDSARNIIHEEKRFVKSKTGDFLIYILKSLIFSHYLSVFLAVSFFISFLQNRENDVYKGFWELFCVDFDHRMFRKSESLNDKKGG